MRLKASNAAMRSSWLTCTRADLVHVLPLPPTARATAVDAPQPYPRQGIRRVPQLSVDVRRRADTRFSTRGP